MLRLTLLLSLLASPALAQTAPYVPEGYSLAQPTGYALAEPAVAVESGTPAAAVRQASAASTAGDPRGAARLLADAERSFPGDSSIRLARAALGMRLDPSLSLRLHEEGRAEALAELRGIRVERFVGLGAGVVSAVAGVTSLALLIAGLVGDVDCDTVLLVVPRCSSTSNGGMLTASAAVGGTALALMVTSIVMLAHAGGRQGAWRERLASHGEVGVDLAFSETGGHAAVSGRF